MKTKVKNYLFNSLFFISLLIFLFLCLIVKDILAEFSSFKTTETADKLWIFAWWGSVALVLFLGIKINKKK